MKGGFGCSPCCGPTCETCTRTCTEPHTGSAFEVVYTRKFEGAEVGNTTDGYLTATGDSDSSDPYNGMDGAGPWFQQVGGGFNDGGSSGGGTRFPCTYRFSFWRSNYTLGASTIPPASTALTKNVITLNVSSGAVVFPDGRVITSADGVVELASIPLVSGGASAADPRTGEGTVSFALQCQNVETLFSVQARIEWNTQKRQHILYGIVRECYEDEGSTNDCCSGSSLPNELYLTISNYTGIVGKRSDGTSLDYNGTYVLEREPNFCAFYNGQWEFSCSISSNPLGESLGTQKIAAWVDGFGYRLVNMYRTAQFSGICRSQALQITSSTTGTYCGTGLIVSGSNGAVYMDVTGYPTLTGTLVSGSFDWEIEA